MISRARNIEIAVFNEIPSPVRIHVKAMKITIPTEKARILPGHN
jgi:hypothetical protein